MPRVLEPFALEVIKSIAATPGTKVASLFNELPRGKNYKCFYNLIYRLGNNGILEKKQTEAGLVVSITPAGLELLAYHHPKKDGVWKIVIFDINEKKKKIRNILRAQLKRLHFKKWQNSIWVSPFELAPEVEDEFKELAHKYSIRLIKAQHINRTDDLEKLFD